MCVCVCVCVCVCAPGHQCASECVLCLQTAVRHVAPRQHETNRFHGEGQLKGSVRSLSPGTADPEETGLAGRVSASVGVGVCVRVCGVQRGGGAAHKGHHGRCVPL